MTAITTQKPVTKTSLTAFVRENSTLNLTQSKVLADQLLADYIVAVRPPIDLGSIPIEVGQLWQYTGTQLILRVTDVELGPHYVPNDPVTTWGPIKVSWQNISDPASTGTTAIEPWRQAMRPAGSVTQVSGDAAQSDPPADPTESAGPS